MFEKIKEKIERKRPSKNIFWILAVKTKDVLWLSQYFLQWFLRVILVGAVLGYKPFILNKNSFKVRVFKILCSDKFCFDIARQNLCFACPSLILNFSKGEYKIMGEYKAIPGYFIDYLPKKGDTVIDAGAFYGLFTILMSLLVGESGKVVAFEPDIEHFKELKKNIIFNKLRNVVLVNKGLYSENLKDIPFWHKDMDSSFVIKFPGSVPSVASVARLDDELKNLGIKKADFIKMDIEGAEIEAIKGAEKTLKNNNLHLAVASYHTLNNIPTYLKLEEILKNYGYKTKNGFKEHLTTYAWKYE